jgi:hypothetical protein
LTNRLLIVALGLALTACGQTADLQPQAGKTLPQKPALASKPLDAAELLALPPQAAPNRVDEINRKGAPRQPDPFDLPPPTGAAMPPPSTEGATPGTTGPDNQDQPH